MLNRLRYNVNITFIVIGKPNNSCDLLDLLYCYVHFLVMVWNWTWNISEVCLYYQNNNSWMTQLLLQDAFLNGYVSEMEKCCLENNIPLNILLTVYDAPWISGPHPDIKVMFLLPNVTSLCLLLFVSVLAKINRVGTWQNVKLT